MKAGLLTILIVIRSGMLSVRGTWALRELEIRSENPTYGFTYTTTIILTVPAPYRKNKHFWKVESKLAMAIG